MAQNVFQYESIVKCNLNYFNILCIYTISTLTSILHKLIIMINFQYTETACTGINYLNQVGYSCVNTATRTHSIYRQHKFLWQNSNHTCWLFSSVIMPLVSHRGLDAECFVFGKHIIHACSSPRSQWQWMCHLS